MKAKKRPVIWNILLIIFICLNLANINAGRFDGDPPPETGIVEQTEVPDENNPPVESTPPAPAETEEAPTEEVIGTEEPPTEEVVASEEPPLEEGVATEQPPTEEVVTTEDAPLEEEVADEKVAPEDEPVAELLSEVPDNTEIVVINENGETVSLAEQEAADIIVEEDPMWCPAGALPGSAGCTTNYSSISALINELTGSRRSDYEQDGIIYFTSGNTNASFDLTRSNIGTSDFNALNDYNLTLQGGWNGSNLGGATFTGTTNFGSRTLTIGDSSYRWQGNIFLYNFSFSNVSNDNAITVYSSNGDITLNNIDVSQQSGNNYTADLNSNSGDITVENSNFDGNNSDDNENRGFRAQTNSGEITVSDATFSDAHDCYYTRRGNCYYDSSANYDGATLDAPTVTLNNVITQNNDGFGINIDNASNTTVTLNNVTAENNGDSGVYVDNSYSTNVTVNGGSYQDNGGYGVEFRRNNRGTLFVTSNPLCGGNRYYGYDGCYNIEPTILTTEPTLNLPGDITAEATSPAGATVSFNVTATDPQDGDLTPICSPASGSNFPIGDTTVNCSVTDSGGHTTTGSFTITVYDSPPVLNLPGDITAEATGPSGAVVNFSATATDLVDGDIPVNCSPASGSTFPITSWFSSGVRVNCSATDSADNTVSGSFRVRVRDTTPPSLNAQNTTAEATGPSGAVVNFTVTAMDLVDPSPYLNCNRDPGDSFPIGTTTVTCLMFDSSLNFNIDSFTVTVQDTTPPTINLPADITEEATGPSGNVVTFSASATDIVDGSRPVTCTPASGSTFPITTTTVNCTASDTRGNTANESFNVIVVDTTPPTLTVPSDIIAEATSSSGAVITFSATATDIADASPTVSCTPPSGNTFPLGTTNVDCSATDDSGNTTNGSFNVTVVDTTPPTLTLPADITEEATGPSGAVVTFSATATDIVDGSVAVTCTPASGSTFVLTTTIVNCSATDNAGNTANGSFKVTVQDKTPPVIAPHEDLFFESWKDQNQVSYSSPTTSDIVDGEGVATCTPASGSMFPTWTTVVTCTATDSNGNVATPVTFKIIIEKIDRPVTNATSSIIPVTGGGLFDISCIDPAVNTLQPPGAKITFNNLCGYQAVLDEVQEEGLPDTLPSGVSFVNGVTVTLLQEDESINPLPGDASFVLGLPTLPDTDGEYAILYWDGDNWSELSVQTNDDGFAEVFSTQTGIFILVTK